MKRKNKKLFTTITTVAGFITTIAGAISSVWNLLDRFAQKAQVPELQYTTTKSIESLKHFKMVEQHLEPNYLLYSIIIFVVGFLIILIGCYYRKKFK